MNIMSAVLVLPLIVLIIIGSNGIHSDHWKIFADDRGIEVPSAPTNTPDIYYLVFDSYSRSDTLNDRFGFDNSTFLNRLKEKGFFVATKSRSNYDSTFPSMASSLNFFYIDELAKKLGKGYRQTKPLHKLIRHNKAAKVLKRMGYTYVTSSSLGGGDVDLFPGKLFNEFRSILFYETPLPVVLQNLRTVFSIKSIYDRHRAVILSQLEQITEITNIKEPTFTYAHILFPHPPFVFSAKGDFIEPSRAFRLQLGLDLGDREENVKGYVAQIEYANARIEQIVDHILEKSDVDPVIIIQADHGPMLEAAEEDNWYLMERYPILNAYYMPKSLDQLYSDISPVNTFPILFNAYFGTDIPLKKDESYQFKWGDPESFEPIEEFL